MPKTSFAIFFSIVISIYLLINLYIFLRGWQALASLPHYRAAYLAAFCVLSLSFLAGRFLERASLSWFSSALVWIGSFWLAAMVYFLLILFCIDILRGVNHFISFFPLVGSAAYQRLNIVALTGIVAAVIVVTIAGFFNAASPRIKNLDLTIHKNHQSLKTLNIVAVSDIHLGTIIGKSRLEHLVEKINLLHADVVLLPGDVVDEDIGPVIKQNLGETLRTIKSKYGVYAITGNHEYIGGVEAACNYLTEHGIVMLRDSTATIGDAVTIVGREDISIKTFARKQRAPLGELMNNVDRTKPIVLMDHQPFHLHEAEEAGVDLQLSGHTHHGQLWPFNFITKKVYELSWGYLKKGATHYYVSCGAGTWGPPVRTGNTPEVMNIHLRFE
jgi:predicted MPP superfamily phosphohydrolase